jgi:hypothetical protein
MFWANDALPDNIFYIFSPGIPRIMIFYYDQAFSLYQHFDILNDPAFAVLELNRPAMCLWRFWSESGIWHCILFFFSWL